MENRKKLKTEKGSPSGQEGQETTDPQDSSISHDSLKAFTQNSESGKPEHQGTQGTEEDLKYRVFEWLRSHPKEKKRGKIKKLAADLGLDYDKSKQTLWQYSSQWKTESRFGAAPKSPPERHSLNVRGYVPVCLDRVKYPEVEGQGVVAGWVLSKNRNRELIWANDLMLGKVRWWRTGKVLAHIEKPQTVDRRNRLLAVAFGASGLIHDRNILVAFIQSFDLFQWHDVHRTPNGEKLPYMVIDDYVELLGIRIKLGDLTHRDAVEIEFIKPEWQERSQRTLEFNGKIIQQNTEAIQSFNQFMKDLSQPRAKPKDDRSVV
jgi:hypothetical protein